MRAKMSVSDRAKQFMPFSPLKGYDKRVKEKEKIVTTKREITEEKSAELSEIVTKIQKGDIVEITYYEKDGYITTVGVVYRIDLIFKKITVIKTVIPFSEIYEIKTVK